MNEPLQAYYRGDRDSTFTQRALLGSVGDCMRAPVDTVDPEMDIFTLAEKFIKEHRRRYPVVSNRRLVGQTSANHQASPLIPYSGSVR